MKIIKRIAIVTTRQNYKWTSMQEVLPGIEKCWQMAAEDSKIESKIINVDVEPLREYAKYILQCDMFIIIAFNETISRFMIQVRQTLNTEAPFVLHLYGHATLGLWPQYRFGVLDLMRTNDAFIGTCPGDTKCMSLTSSNALCYEVPYPHIPLDLTPVIKEKVFAYVGRISDQKNLDILINSYYLLKQRRSNIPKLVIYGKEDNFGSPNMGIASTDYLNNLKEMLKKLGLENEVVFKGFMPREEIYKELGSNHIFVTASTHSDENFGMALMRSLACGALAVVSNWGGHKVFKTHCQEKVWTVPVYFENFHPRPSVDDFSNAMEEALDSNIKNDTSFQLPEYFSMKNVAERFKEIFCSTESKGEPLLISVMAQRIYQQQSNFEKEGDIQRAFDSYEDPLAQLLLSAYL